MSLWIKRVSIAMLCCVLYGPVAAAQTTTTWTGSAQDANWNNAGNWNNGVPTAADHAVINNSNGFNPVLDVDVTVKDLTINNDAVFLVNGHTVTVNGNLTVTTSNTAGDGLIMTDAADVVVVEGNAVFTTLPSHGAASSGGNFTDGIMHVRGNFTQVQNGSSGSTGSFLSTGTTVIFDGTAPQSVSFATSGTGASRFRDLDLDNAAGIIFTTSAVASGTVTIIDGTITSAGGTVTIGDDLIDPVGNRWQVLTTNFNGASVSLPATLTTNVSFSGGGVLENGFTVTGNVTVIDNGHLVLNGQTVFATGNLTVTTSNTAGDGLIMTNASDELIINGNAVFTTLPSHGAASSSGNYTAGVLRVRGDFTQTRNGSSSSAGSFTSTGTKVIFDGTNPQIVTFSTPGTGASLFRDVDMVNAAGITFTTDIFFSGQLTLFSNTTLNQSTGISTLFTTHLPVIPSDATYNVVNTQVIGTIFMGAPVTFAEAINDLFVIADAKLTVNGHQLDIGGNLTVTTSNTAGDGLIMTDAADVVVVEGNALFTTLPSHGAASSSGNYTAGVMHVRGDFTQTRNGSSASTGSFVSTGTKVIFDGTTPQSVSFATSGTGASRFRDLDLANAAGVAFNTSAVASGTVTIIDGTITSAGGTVTIGDDLIDPVGNRWQVLNTDFNGAGVSLPATLITNVSFSGGGALENGFTVTGNVTVIDNGHLVLNGQTVSATGNLTVTTSNTAGDGLIMTHASDELIINGNAVFTTLASHSAATSSGNYTAGILRVRGDFTQTRNGGSSSAETFTSTGTKVILDGTSPQTVTFHTPGTGASRFRDVDLINTAPVTFLTDVYFSGKLTLGSGADLIQGGGNSTFYTAHLPSVPPNGTYGVINTQVIGEVVMEGPVTMPESSSQLFVNPNARLVINGQRLEIGGSLTVTTSNTAGDGLIMNDPADEVFIGGNALFTTSANHSAAFSSGNFSNGVMRVRGDFTQTRNGSSASTGTFTSTGTKVVFDGTGTQTIHFEFPSLSSSYFDDVSFENPNQASIHFNTSIVVNGQLQSPGHIAPLIVGNGLAMTVHGGLDAENMILDNVALTVNQGAIDRFNRITFRNYGVAANQMTINHADMNASFFGVKFEVTPTSGKYLVVNDTDGGAPATLNMINADPIDGSAFTTTTGGFVINWVTQLYAVDDADTTLEDTPITLNVLDNDLNPNGNALIITGVTQGANGSVLIDPGGTTVTYTPSQDFNGTDSFTYIVVDQIAEESDTGSVMIVVTPNDNPIIAAPSTLLFGKVVVGQTVNKNVTVQNTGDDNLNVSNLTVSAPFSVDNTPFVIGPGSSHEVTISFTPGQVGDFESTLSITSDDPQTPIDSVTVTGTGIEAGDLSGDGQLNVLDIISLINIILGHNPAPAPGSQQFQAADLTGDGQLNILDIVALVNQILNPPTAKVVASISPAYVGLEPVQTLENRRQQIPVSFTTEAPVAGLQMTVHYDPSTVRLLAPEPTDRLGDLSMEWTDDGGVMQILIYSATGGSVQPGQIPIFHIPVDLLTQEGTVTLDHFIAATPQAVALPVTITTAQSRVSTLPTSFSLGENRPNPFNPSTTIAFEVPQAAHITLTVYNVLGQEVVRLIDEQRLPGRYEVVWHGRNAQGAGVSTGIYMYRLVSSTGFAEAKRMTLLK